MGHRHNVLTDDIFKKSNYIKATQMLLNCEKARDIFEKNKSNHIEELKKLEKKNYDELINDNINLKQELSNKILNMIKISAKGSAEQHFIDIYKESMNKIDFRKDYREQYDFMLNTFKTLILVNNCFFSDSNFGMNEKLTNFRKILGNYIYKDFNDEIEEPESEKGINNYSIRFIQSIYEKHSVYIYNKIKEWYEYADDLNANDKELKEIIKEIEYEMERLERIKFDNIITETFEYQKDKNYNNKIYVSKLNKCLYKNVKSIRTDLKKYLNKFYNDIDDNKLDEICLIFELVANANNGIINLNKSTQKSNYYLNTDLIFNELFTKYLNQLNVEIKRPDDFILLSIRYMFDMKKIIDEIQEQKIEIDKNNFINNYDFFRFIAIIGSKNYIKHDYKNEKLVNDILDKLKSIYDILMKDINNEPELINKSSILLSILQSIINDYPQFFERICY